MPSVDVSIFGIALHAYWSDGAVWVRDESPRGTFSAWRTAFDVAEDVALSVREGFGGEWYIAYYLADAVVMRSYDRRTWEVVT